MKTNYKIIRLGKGDAVLMKKLVNLFNNVFGTDNTKQPELTHLRKLLAKKEFIAIAAIIDEDVIGGLTAYELPLYNNNKEAYLYDIAVNREYQRKGVGKKLIAALKKQCKQNGIKLFFVEANEEDKHAIKFYNAIGGKGEKVMHFNFSFLK
jgi:aminoglycoside 3-N-acetyltransferase I